MVAAAPGQSAMRAMYAFLSGLNLDNVHVGEGRDLIGTSIRNLIRDQNLVPGTDIGHERALQDRRSKTRQYVKDLGRWFE